MKILVVTTEPVPLPGLAATGAGLRAWGLAEGLRSRGFEVTVGMPAEVVGAAASASAPLFAQALDAAGAAIFERPHLTDFIRAAHPDVLVMQHWGLMDRLGPVECPLALDLAGPHLLERLYWGSAHPDRDLEDKVAALARADFLTCSGPTQRAYFLAFAIASGHDPAAPDLLPVIPFSVAPDHPHAGAHDPGTFVYTGFLLPWQDPSRGIEALLGRLEARQQGRLVFVGGAHPAGDVSRGRFDAILARLAASPRAELRSPMPYASLLELLGQAGTAWDLMARNPERELAFPSRTAIYLASGLPVVTGDYGDLARWVAEYDAGWCVGERPNDLENVLEGILGNPSNISAKANNARRLVADRMTWDETVEPLARWCARPARRRAAGPPPAEALRSSQALRRQLEAAEARLGELGGRRLVRLSNFLRRLRGR
jgi:hypothetical protein